MSLEPINNISIKDSNEQLHDPKKSIWTKTKALLIQHWFLLGIGASIALAAAYPPLGKKKGHLRSEYTVKYGVVGLIFVLSGLSLKTKVILESALSWKIHALIQILSLGLFPAIGLCVGTLLKLTTFNRRLADGLIIACTTPTTISSNVLMTKQAGGNEVAALFNAVMGNILGVFISPSLVSAYVGSTSQESFDYSQVFIDLSLTVVGPLILGQLFQFFFPTLLKKIQDRISLAITNSFLLLILVWSVFCDSKAFYSYLTEVFASKDVSSLDAGSLVGVIILDISLFVLFSAIAFGLSLIPVVGFTRQDTVAIVMCAATKTVALGVPMINIIYGRTSDAGILAIPLLIYHAQQLIIGSFYVARFQKWTKLDQSEEHIDLSGEFTARRTNRDVVG